MVLKVKHFSRYSKLRADTTWNVVFFNIIQKNVFINNGVHGEVYSIQHYVIKFVSDLLYVGGFLQVLRLLPPINVLKIQSPESNTLSDQFLRLPQLLLKLPSPTVPLLCRWPYNLHFDQEKYRRGKTPANLKPPLINHTSCGTCRLVFICTSETYGINKHRWFSG